MPRHNLIYIWAFINTILYAYVFTIDRIRLNFIYFCEFISAICYTCREAVTIGPRVEAHKIRILICALM